MTLKPRPTAGGIGGAGAPLRKDGSASETKHAKCSPENCGADARLGCLLLHEVGRAVPLPSARHAASGSPHHGCRNAAERLDSVGRPRLCRTQPRLLSASLLFFLPQETVSGIVASSFPADLLMEKGILPLGWRSVLSTLRKTGVLSGVHTTPSRRVCQPSSLQRLRRFHRHCVPSTSVGPEQAAPQGAQGRALRREWLGRRSPAHSGQATSENTAVRDADTACRKRNCPCPGQAGDC